MLAAILRTVRNFVKGRVSEIVTYSRKITHFEPSTLHVRVPTAYDQEQLVRSIVSPRSPAHLSHRLSRNARRENDSEYRSVQGATFELNYKYQSPSASSIGSSGSSRPVTLTSLYPRLYHAMQTPSFAMIGRPSLSGLRAPAVSASSTCFAL